MRNKTQPQTPFVFRLHDVLKTYPETSIGPPHPFPCLLLPPLLFKIKIMLIFLAPLPYSILVTSSKNMRWALQKARTSTNSLSGTAPISMTFAGDSGDAGGGRAVQQAHTAGQETQENSPQPL